jgi:arginyl-tRNA synthetase
MKHFLKNSLAAALERLGAPPDHPVSFETPRQADHGDLTTNVAMTLAKKLGKPPRQLAAEIIAAWSMDRSFVSRVEIAGPGFINLTFTEAFYRARLGDILSLGAAYGRSSGGAGRRVQVEFVSANPTGPLTVGHGWGAVFGDTVARLYEWTGHAVEREYYFNNAGRQMRILGDSVRLRYLQLIGDDVQFPDDYYQGEYIREIAGRLREEAGDGLRNEPAEGAFKARAEEEIFADIRKTLKAVGVVFDAFFNEYSLYTDGKITEVVEELRAKGLVYEQDGATWLKLSALGNEKDKVIIKSTGEPTYRLPDIAYHREKFRRNFDLMVDVFGADHIATYPDVLAGLRALGYDPAKVRVLIHQFVTIVQNGEAVKMSTRKANFFTLDELIEEVGADVVRYFFLMRTITSHMNFDLGLAKQNSLENPVFYVQYGHARINSIFQKAAQSRHAALPESPALDLLTAPEEIALIKTLLQFPELVESCAATNEPHRLTEYLHGLAGEFHGYYTLGKNEPGLRVITENGALTGARLALCRATQIVFRNGLAILGISAPDAM